MGGAEEQFGRYLLRGRLAFGGMAEIFAAELRGEEGFARRLVVKRILPQFCADPVFVQMFVDEAVLAARISHPNVVQVYDFGHVEGVYFLAMEYIDGVDLRRILTPPSERTRLTAAETAALGEAAARGLAHAHAERDDAGRPLHLVHRDVSPHNIMVARTGEVKLMDFGIAKAEARVSRTGTGMIKGKLAYMSPEQAAGRPLDKRSDQFSLGVVLWECISGARLFAGGSDLEILRRVVECRVRPLHEACAEAPAELAAAIHRCLEPDPDRRWPDLSDLAEALAAFRFSLGSAGVAHLGQLVPAPAPPEPARRTLPLEPPPGGQTTTAAVDLEPLVPPTAEQTTPAAADRAPAPPIALPPAVRRPAATAHRPTPHRRAAFVGAAVVGLAVALALWAIRRPQRQPARPVAAAVSMLRVDSQPPGARVLVAGRDTGLTTPASLPIADVNRPLDLGLQRTGFDPFRSQVWPAAVKGQLAVSLVPAPSTPTAPLGAAPAVAAAEVARSAAPSSPRGSAVSGKGRARPARRVERGQLSLRTTGAWVEVFLGAQKLGTTPLTRVEVPAGRLRLRLVNALAGIDRVVEVEVAADGETQRTITTK